MNKKKFYLGEGKIWQGEGSGGGGGGKWEGSGEWVPPPCPPPPRWRSGSKGCFCDISKAFDRVWHKGLIYKLKKAGINGLLLDWLSDYLTNKKQRVFIPGGRSDWQFIRTGVPQGSILGPLLFLLYINDIVADIQSCVRLFSDDTILYIIVDNPTSAAEMINTDLETIHRWGENG